MTEKLPFDSRRSKLISRVETATSMLFVTQDLVNVELTENSWPGGRLALMTSGDDVAGMNAGIRAVVSVCNHLGCQVTFIKGGIYGLVHGGDEHFQLASISETMDILPMGGTIIKSLKYPQFSQRSARMAAAKNLVERELSHLLVMGGDGTMAAMKLLWEDWVGLLKDLDNNELVPRHLLRAHRHLKLGVISSSTTNDVCGIDVCIGADTALHRIIEVIDSIYTTATSAKLAFIIELMGEKCGYLTLCAGLATSATKVFIPEWPSQGDWRDELNYKVREDLANEVQAIIVLVAAGARDKNGRAITAKDVGQVLEDKHGLETAITVLGHVQKGGTPSAYDRMMASRLSAEAVMALHYRDAADPPFIMGIIGNEVTCLPLIEVVKRNDEVVKSLESKDFVNCVKRRGRKFQDLLSTYRMLNLLQPSPILRLQNLSPSIRRIAIIRVGRYSVGQCMAAKSIVGYCASKGVAVLAVSKGFEGLVPPRAVQTLTWEKVLSWSSKTSHCFGSSRFTPNDVGMDVVATALDELKLSGVILLGSFHAFESLYQMHKAQAEYKSLSIPMCFLPVTILNNIPGSEMTIGCDSALNENVTYCDKIKRMAKSMDASVIVVETMGHNCGYLTTATAVSAGSDVSYIPNEPFNISTMLVDTHVIKSKITDFGMQIGLVLHSENANDNYTSQFTYQLYSEEGKGVYQCRHETIGHVQVGVEPSPQDRISATVQGLVCGEWLVNKIRETMRQDGTVFTTDVTAKTVLCETRSILFRNIAKLANETNFQHKLPKYLWWGKLRKLARILSKLPTDSYETEMVDWTGDEDEAASSNSKSSSMMESWVGSTSKNIRASDMNKIFHG